MHTFYPTSIRSEQLRAQPEHRLCKLSIQVAAVCDQSESHEEMEGLRAGRSWNQTPDPQVSSVYVTCKAVCVLPSHCYDEI